MLVLWSRQSCIIFSRFLCVTLPRITSLRMDAFSSSFCSRCISLIYSQKISDWSWGCDRISSIILVNLLDIVLPVLVGNTISECFSTWFCFINFSMTYWDISSASLWALFSFSISSLVYILRWPALTCGLGTSATKVSPVFKFCRICFITDS